LSNLTNLTQLLLASNQITGVIPESLGNLFSLQLTGSIPENLGNLSTLNDLDLSANQLTGNLPESLGDLNQLNYLYLNNNLLDGPIPMSICTGLSDLLTLFINYNNFSQSDCPEIQCLIDKTGFTFFHSPQNDGFVFMDDCGPSLYTDSLALVALYNSTDGPNWTDHTNWLTGPVNTWFGIEIEEGRVTEVNMGFYGNNMTGTLPEEMGDLTELKELGLYRNQISGAIPETFSGLEKLEFLFLNENELSGIIPEYFGLFTDLQLLWLDNNQFTGSIPESFSALNNLVQLHLGMNQLTGGIPEFLGNLVGLEVLYLSDNDLDGTIPEALSNLTNLTQLLLASNQITGVIPESLGNLFSLQHIDLSYNQFTGIIPESFINLENLESLTLNDNFIDSPIPDMICSSMANLDWLQLERNNFDQQDCPAIQCLIDRGGWSVFDHSPQNDGFVFMEDCCEDATAYAGEDDEMCISNAYFSVNGTAENYTEILWTTNGSGYFDPPASLQPKYYPSDIDIIQGEVEICLTAIAAYTCQDASDCITLTFIPAPVVYAGDDQTIISNETATLSATAENYTGLLWETNGDGLFSNETIANPTYTPGEDDVVLGNVELCITASPLSPCAYDSTDCIILTIIPDIIAGFSATPESGLVPLTVQFTDLTEGNPLSWQWDFENDGTIDSEDQNPIWVYDMPGVYSVSLFVSNGFDDETEIKFNYITVDFNTSATIQSISDVPDDQGGWVYVHFLRSIFDTDTLQDWGDAYNVEMLIDDHWVTANNISAYGADQYTALCHTTVDSSQYGPGLIDFRVIAVMQEGNFASDISQGYSVDNLSPAIPRNLTYDLVAEDLTITWEPCPDFDFEYFAIYKSDINGEFPDLPFATTLESTFSDQVAYADSAFYVITAIDLRGNESDVSEQIRITPRIKWELPAGWSGISSYLDPTDPAVPNIFQDVLDELIIIQTETTMYWPAQNVNTIGNWSSLEGYKIKLSDSVKLEVAGSRSQYSSLDLGEGWNLIPVLSECAVDVEVLFEATGLVIAKEVAGNNVYWPEYGINSLGGLYTGNAYFVLMENDEEIGFPECAKGKALSPEYRVSQHPGTPFTLGSGDTDKVFKTPITHSIALPSSSVGQLEIGQGSLIAAFNEEDICCGIVEWQNKNAVLTVYGDDPLTAEKDGALENENLYFRIVEPETGNEIPLTISWDANLPHADGLFHAHGLSAFDGIGLTGFDTHSVFGQIQIFPNPASKEINIIIDLNQTVTVEFLNQLGEICMNTEILSSKSKVDISGLSPGIYLVSLTGDQGRIVKKLVVK